MPFLKTYSKGFNTQKILITDKVLSFEFPVVLEESTLLFTESMTEIRMLPDGEINTPDKLIPLKLFRLGPNIFTLAATLFPSHSLACTVVTP